MRLAPQESPATFIMQLCIKQNPKPTTLAPPTHYEYNIPPLELGTRFVAKRQPRYRAVLPPVHTIPTQ